MWLRRFLKFCNIFVPLSFVDLKKVLNIVTYVSGNNCLFTMHAIIRMPSKLDICDNDDKSFDDGFYVNLKYAVIFPSRLRLNDVLKF